MSNPKPKTKTPSARGVKATTVHVSRLGEALKSRGLRLKDSEVIEIAAHAFGFRDGNTLAAAQKAGHLTLTQPSVAERIRLTGGERLVVLADPAEGGLFAISRDLLAGTACPAVVAAPSGRLVDLSAVAADADGEGWNLAASDDAIEITLHTATIYHRHGHDSYAALTEADLDRQVAQYCRDSWHEIEVDPSLDPDTMADAAVSDTYFAALPEGSEESYESGVHTTRVGRGELQALVAAAVRKAADASHAASPAPARTPARQDPLAAWKTAVAAGTTELGYDAWSREQPRAPAEIPAGCSRQFLLDPAELAVLQTVAAYRLKMPAAGAPHLTRQSWARIGEDLEDASRRMAANAFSDRVVITLSDEEADAIREALKEYSVAVGGGRIVPPGDPVSYGFSLEMLIERFAFDEPVIYLTNGCCENAHGDQALFDRLGLTAGDDDGAFDPLTAAEREWIFEDSLSHKRGEILMAYTGLYRGQKYLMPVLTLYHDPEDDATNEANAEYIERVVMRQITPGVEALGGLVRFERDDEDDRHALQILLPFSATRGCTGYIDWCDRVRAILDGADVAKLLATLAPEPFAYRDSRTNAVIAMGAGDLPAIGSMPVLKDLASRRVAGRVIGHRTIRTGETQRDVLYRVEMRDGMHHEPGPLAMMPQELEQTHYMTLAEVRALKPGDRVISLVDGLGDVEADDESDGDGDMVEREFKPGDWLTVESVETLPAPQGFAVTVVAENGVCNVFDAGDYAGLYPFLRPAD